MGSELTPEEHATAILTWLRAMFDAGSTLTDASDIARLAPPIAAHIREYAASLVAAQRERDAGIAEEEADRAGRVYGEARDAAFNIAAAIRKQA